jgi:hypothetical protein
MTKVLRWQVFVALGVVHLVVFPLLLSERSDELVAMAAGALYLLLATLGWRDQHRRAGGSHGP